MTAHMISRFKTLLFAMVSVFTLGACGDSGPEDTTIVLNLDAVDSPTNQASIVVSGSTDAGSSVRIETPADTAEGSASGQGAFSFNLGLALNQLNSVAVTATDPAGNRASDTLSVLHDNITPTVNFTSPGANVGSQSGFTITVALNDESSGVDATSLSISNSEDIGGAFKTDGTSSPTVTANGELVSLFSVSGGQASFVVPDSFFFRAGVNELSASVSDNAGNSSSASLDLTVDPDAPRLIIVDASGAAGQNVTLTVGLANGVTLSGLQFDVVFDTLVVDSVISPNPVDRANNFSDSPSNEIEAGRLRVLLFDGGGATIDQGQGAVIELTLALSATAAPGAGSVDFQDIIVSEPGGATSGLADASGTLTVQ